MIVPGAIPGIVPAPPTPVAWLTCEALGTVIFNLIGLMPSAAANWLALTPIALNAL